MFQSAQQPGSVNLAGNAKIAGMDSGIYQPGVPHSMNDSTSSTVLAMQEISIGPKSAAYQQSTVQQKELGTSNKVGWNYNYSNLVIYLIFYGR